MQQPSLTEYVQDLLGEDPLLRQIRDEAATQGLPAIYVPLGLGRLLQILVSACRAESVLEIGTLFGYSAILMARALAADGHLVTLEADEIHARAAGRNIQRAGVEDRVEIRQGRAIDLLPDLSTRQFDLIFIDADKQSYPQYLEWALRLTHRGSIIVADNVWRQGGVVHPDGDGGNEAVATFNRAVASNPSLVTTIVPRLDGGDAASISVVT